MAPGPARRNSLIETLSGSGTPMVIGQPPAYRDGHRRAPGRLPGPSGRRKEAAFLGARFPAPGLSQPGTQPPVLRRLLCTDLGVHGLRVVLSPFLDPVSHRLRHQAVGPRHLGYCPVPSPATSRTTCSLSSLLSPCAVIIRLYLISQNSTLSTTVQETPGTSMSISTGGVPGVPHRVGPCWVGLDGRGVRPNVNGSSSRERTFLPSFWG